MQRLREVEALGHPRQLPLRVRDVYAGLESEFGIVDYFVDLHKQWPCYAQEGTGDMSPLSISARFIADPTEFGGWPNFDDDASRRANVAVYDALQSHGESAFGDLTLYPQDTDLPGTALGSFALRGSATVLFETSSNTQSDGQKRNGFLAKQSRSGSGGSSRPSPTDRSSHSSPRLTRRSRSGTSFRPTDAHGHRYEAARVFARAASSCRLRRRQHGPAVRRASVRHASAAPGSTA